jgi:hypothetical protein
MGVRIGARQMATTDTTALTPGSHRFSAFHWVAFFCGVVPIVVLYATIVLIDLITLSLVEVRQVNMANFNALIATLEQRDRDRDEKTGLPYALARVRLQREKYDDAIAHPTNCFSVTGAILDDAQNTVAAAERNNGASKPRPQPMPCEQIRNTLRNHANELMVIEDAAMFKLANVDEYYLRYVDGITQKMPQIIPALRFLDSGQPWIDSWARSSFELMEMFLVVSMGMLGGIINTTRWLVDRSQRSPSLRTYFYKPAVGGAIALGAFVVFRAVQLVVGGPIQDGAVPVTASIYLLAGLGLVSGFCADKALRQMEKAADRLFHLETLSGSKTHDAIDHHTVPVQ